MPTTGLKHWSDIKASFGDCLLLGNGASIEMDGRFDYKNLLRMARTKHLITDRVKTVFDHFSTTDFEYVLKMLCHADSLNKALGVTETNTLAAYRQVREALVKTIRLIHPEYCDIEPRLGPFSKFLKRFDTVLSLNYDLILYWARMLANEQDTSVSFKDCFVSGGAFQQRRLAPFPQANPSRKALYLSLLSPRQYSNCL